MKKLSTMLMMSIVMIACGGVLSDAQAHGEMNTDQEQKSVKQLLIERNERYMKGLKNEGDLSPERRKETAEKGQKPYAVVVTCSDSRVPPEHLFSAGLGEMFVVRTAGNVIGDFELGSIEYGVSQLKAKAVIVLGHRKCGAVAAAMSGFAEGKLQSIVDEIRPALNGITDSRIAEERNVLHSLERIEASEIIRRFVEKDGLELLPAIYDIETGKVDFLPNRV